MTVLFMEDRGATAYNVERWLNESGHRVLSAFNPNDAQSHWNHRNETPIDCILLDLQTPMDGLTDDQKRGAEGGTLAGWVWLRDSVLSVAPEMRERTVIYSDFIPVLRLRVPEEQLRALRLVSKRNRGSSADEVVASIREIAKRAAPGPAIAQGGSNA